MVLDAQGDCPRWSLVFGETTNRMCYQHASRCCASPLSRWLRHATGQLARSVWCTPTLHPTWSGLMQFL